MANHGQFTEIRNGRVTCADFDPKEPTPMYVNGKCIGQLMPRATAEVLAASPGIQSWSRPKAK